MLEKKVPLLAAHNSSAFPSEAAAALALAITCGAGIGRRAYQDSKWQITLRGLVSQISASVWKAMIPVPKGE